MPSTASPLPPPTASGPSPPSAAGSTSENGVAPAAVVPAALQPGDVLPHDPKSNRKSKDRLRVDDMWEDASSDEEPQMSQARRSSEKPQKRSSEAPRRAAEAREEDRDWPANDAPMSNSDDLVIPHAPSPEPELHSSPALCSGKAFLRLPSESRGSSARSTETSRSGSSRSEGTHLHSLSLPQARHHDRSTLRTRSQMPEMPLPSPPLGSDRRSSSHKRSTSVQSAQSERPELVRPEPVLGEGLPLQQDGREEDMNLSAPPMSPGSPLTPAAEKDKRLPPPIETRSARKHHGSGNYDERSDPGVPRGPFSIWDYLQEELYATDYDAAQELRLERVSNFMAVPFRVEEVIVFGFVTCFDAFLYAFTIGPLRFGIALVQAGCNCLARIRGIKGAEGMRLSASQKCDIIKLVLLVLACSFLALSNWNDAGKMYHSVRGQDLIKLYVIFNVLEIADRLCCSIGQDVLDSLFSRSTLVRRKDGSLPHLRVLGLFLLSLGYIVVHTLVLSYQMVALNVAINSYDHSLMSLLISNQFVEIKGSVFKKFEKENLFQVTCADIVERFQMFLMVCFIAARNLVEVAGFHGADALPSSTTGQGHWFASLFKLLPSYTVLERTLFPAAVVLSSEVFVDWLKHAFITKFNHIRPGIYGRFIDVLCRDLLMGSPAATEPSPSPEAVDKEDKPQATPRRSTFVDQAPIVSRRLGFAPLPLACLLVQVIIQIAGMLRAGTESFEDIFEASDQQVNPPDLPMGTMGVWTRTVAPLLAAVTTWTAALLTALVAWAFLVGIKVVIGMNLVSYAEHRWATAGSRAGEEAANGRSRAPIGMHPREIQYEKTTRTLLERGGDNDAPVPSLHGDPPLPAQSGKKRTPDLLEIGRYTMVRSRLW